MGGHHENKSLRKVACAAGPRFDNERWIKTQTGGQRMSTACTRHPSDDPVAPGASKKDEHRLDFISTVHKNILGLQLPATRADECLGPPRREER